MEITDDVTLLSTNFSIYCIEEKESTIYETINDLQLRIAVKVKILIGKIFGFCQTNYDSRK